MWNFIKKLIPLSFKKLYKKIRYNPQLKLAKDYYYDFNRFRKYSASFNLKTKENYTAYLIKEYHAIEKGLALRQPKQGFGITRFTKFTNILEDYLAQYGKDDVTDSSMAALEQYQLFEHKNNNFNNPILADFIRIRNKYYPNNFESILKFGGVKKINKKDIIEILPAFENFNRFFKSRHSTRDFSDIPVNRNDIKDAIITAISTPSVCNRQAWKVYMVDSEKTELKDKFLKVQNGNKGFGQHIDTLLIITGKLSNFFLIERNQIFIDGGMFAMSVILSLHAKGLGTCCLNTSYTAQNDIEFRKVASNLDEDCVPIMFIAVGNLKDQYQIAISRRKDISKILVEL